MEEVCGMQLAWESNWNGEEVGYPEVELVGLYSDTEGNYYYIDMDNGIVLETFRLEEEE